jgi:hypothetical protein
VPFVVKNILIRNFAFNSISDKYLQKERDNNELNLNCFLKDFENSFSMHVVSVQYRELVEKDIYRVVEEIIGS